MGRSHEGLVLRHPVLDTAVIFILRPQHQTSGCHRCILCGKLEWLEQEAHRVPGKATLRTTLEWGNVRSPLSPKPLNSVEETLASVDKSVLSISLLREL